MNPNYNEQVDTFLKAKNVAIAGYSTNKNQPANSIYKRFSENGYNVFAINPKAEAISDVKCYSSLQDIAETVDAVVICTPPLVTLSVVNECIKKDIKNIWIHRSVDQGSYNAEAVELGKKNNINCIACGCPLMFLNADFPHKCIRWFMDVTGKLKN
jgi:uncharacterized protein